ncbi:hypothetical protein JD969_06855 [Planctomycetota bacterium]|nr:hypothetical protein JD969_06855 [Planctomycetota bacterium]
MDLIFWAYFLVSCVVVGMLMWVIGWWGKKVDDHPVCRKCGYDLVGMKKDMREANQRIGEVCAECGAELGEKRRRVRVGNVKKRKWVMWLGVLLLMSGVGGIGVMGWGYWKMKGAHGKKPVWLLVLEMQNPTLSFDVDGVSQELWKRVGVGAGQMKVEEWGLVRDGMLKIARAHDTEAETWKWWGAILNDVLAGEPKGDTWTLDGQWGEVNETILRLAAEKDLEWDGSWGFVLKNGVAMWGGRNDMLYEGMGNKLLDLSEVEGVTWENDWGVTLFELHEKGFLSEEEQKRWVELLCRHWQVRLPRKVCAADLYETRMKVHSQYMNGVKSFVDGWYEGTPMSLRMRGSAVRRGSRSTNGRNWGGVEWRMRLKGLKLGDEVIEVDELKEFQASIVGVSRLDEGELMRQFRDGIKDVAARSKGEEMQMNLLVEVELDLGGQTQVINHVVLIDGNKVEFVEEKPVAELVDDEEKAVKVRKQLKCVSAMKIRMDKRVGDTEYYAPYAHSGDKFVMTRRQTESGWWLTDGKDYEWHADFVLARNSTKLADVWKNCEHVTFRIERRVESDWCYRVFLRVDGQEYDQYSYVTHHQGRVGQELKWRMNGYRLPSGVEAKKCDVVLRPAPKWAYSYEHMEKILGEEIVFEDVNLLMVSDEELDAAIGRWVDLRDRAKKHLVEVGEYASLEEIEKTISKLEE